MRGGGEGSGSGFPIWIFHEQRRSGPVGPFLRSSMTFFVCLSEPPSLPASCFVLPLFRYCGRPKPFSFSASPFSLFFSDEATVGRITRGLFDPPRSLYYCVSSRYVTLSWLLGNFFVPSLFQNLSMKPLRRSISYSLVPSLFSSFACINCFNLGTRFSPAG